MTGGTRGDTLHRFARFLAKNMGLHFAGERLPELGQKLALLAGEQGFPDLNDYLARLMSGPLPPEQLDRLARTLTIGETYFLRDPKSYRVLAEQLLPPLIAARRDTNRTLRLWSAGCSTGEEPYSLAILLSRLIPDLSRWKITILGSDINPQALERARLGVYGQWSFRNAPDWLMDYFQKRADGGYEILPQIRDMVRFARLNLVDPRELAACEWTIGVDVIFCRNVMLYFAPTQIQKTMACFHESLRESGWLFVGPTEIDHGNFRGFSCRQYDGAFVLGKEAVERREARPHWCEELLNAPDRWSADLPVVPPPVPAAPCVAAPEAGNPEGEGAPAADGYERALALYEAGNYQGAVELALGPSGADGEQARAWALGARAYANIGNFAEARRCCEKAIDCDRLDAHSHYLFSIILEQQGDLPGAVGSLKNALFIDHDYLLAYFALGNLSRRRGDQKEAQRNFANALRLLERHHPHEVLAEAEGMTAGRLAEMIRGMVKRNGEASSPCPSR